MNAVVEVKVVPLGTHHPSISSIIQESLGPVEMTGLNYRLTPTSTVIEGDLDQVLDLIRKMHEAPFATGIARVLTTITIDERRDKENRMQNMVEAVDPRLLH